MPEHPDNQAGTQDDGRDQGNLAATGLDGRREPFDNLLSPGNALAGEQQQNGSTQDGQGSGELGRIATVEQAFHQDSKRHQEKPAGDQQRPDRNTRFIPHAFQVIPVGKSVDAEPHGTEEQYGWQDRGRHDGGIGCGCKFDHDEGTGAHQGRHDLSATGGDSFHRPGKGRRIAQPAHGRQGERPGRGDIGGRRARNRTEQGRCQHGDLGRPRLEPARAGQRQVHEPLARLTGIQHRTENDKNRNHGNRHAGKLSP